MFETFLLIQRPNFEFPSILLYQCMGSVFPNCGRFDHCWLEIYSPVFFHSTYLYEMYCCHFMVRTLLSQNGNKLWIMSLQMGYSSPSHQYLHAWATTAKRFSLVIMKSPFPPLAQTTSNSQVWVPSLKQWHKNSDDSLSDVPTPQQKLAKLQKELSKLSDCVMEKLCETDVNT